ncbi:MAG: metallophosphoesterase [Lachnospiraceae bacterium]|nr:metallophosphoesterase [Lachnospiraceae bacterium]
MKLAIIILIIFLIIFIIWQTHELKQFDVTHYYINSPKITKPHRICVISDLHQHSYGHYNDVLIDSIKAQEPDMIAIPGDMIVDTKPYQYGVASSFLSKISEIAPIYFSNGNHEKRVEDRANPNHIHYELYKEALSNFNIYTLNNTGVRFDDEIEIYGLDLPTTYYTKGKRHHLSSMELMNMVGAEVREDVSDAVCSHEPDETGSDNAGLLNSKITDAEHLMTEDFFGSEDKTDRKETGTSEADARAQALEAEMKKTVSDEKLDNLLNSNSQMAALYSDLMRSKHEPSVGRVRKQKQKRKHRSLLASMVFAETDRIERDRKDFELESLEMKHRIYENADRKRENTGCFKDDSKYRILLAHNPEFGGAYAGAGFDMSLCGHYHGGLVCLPNGKAVISPNFTLFPEYASGDNVVRGRHVITSRGLGTHTFNIRVFDRAELVVIHLLPEGANDAFKYKDPFDDIDFTAL